jgi:hypothetical protein
MNTTPIFPQVIYPIGELADGRFIAEVGARGFRYMRELPDLDFSLPELDFDDDEPDTIPDGRVSIPDERDTIPSLPSWEENVEGPPTLRPEEIKRQPWYRRAISWCRAA